MYMLRKLILHTDVIRTNHTWTVRNNNMDKFVIKYEISRLNQYNNIRPLFACILR